MSVSEFLISMSTIIVNLVLQDIAVLMMQLIQIVRNKIAQNLSL
jgi:hypothetical protein